MKLQVGLLGARGAVGQKILALLAHHPRLEVVELVASEAHVGEPYGKRISWREAPPLLEPYADLPLIRWEEARAPYLLSSLPAGEAASIEVTLTKRGHHVISNAAAHRLLPKVPLLVPEVNLDHLSWIDEQESPGKLVTNPNCIAIPLSMALAPLCDLQEISQVHVVTMQAASGAGYGRLFFEELQANILPTIPGEAAKVRRETAKILQGRRFASSFPLCIQTHRVPIPHGHFVAIQVTFAAPFSLKQVEEAFGRQANSYPEGYSLHHAPHAPQPAMVGPFDFQVHLGQIEQQTERTLSLVALSHNLVRGAAGAAILNLEALATKLEGTPTQLPAKEDLLQHIGSVGAPLSAR